MANSNTPTISLEQLTALDTKKETSNFSAIPFGELDMNKPYKLMKWKQVDYDYKGESRTSYIGELEDGTEFWMPKSLQRKICHEDPPHLFTYAGRAHDGYNSYKTNVWLGSLLRAKGMWTTAGE